MKEMTKNLKVNKLLSRFKSKVTSLLKIIKVIELLGHYTSEK